MHGQPKKTILFTIEITERELFAKCLLALEMARRGFRVYIGSFRAIHEIRGKISSCIFFHKSGYRRRIRDYKRRMGATVAVLDEELGAAIPASRVAIVCAERFASFDRSNYDYIFTIGEGYRQRLSAMPNLAGINIVATGWPRIDLWREEFQGIHGEQTTALRQRYGDYLLFISSFGFTSQAGYDYLLSVVDAESGAASVHNTWAAFNNYVELLRRLACETGERIVIRPHTSESLDDWRALFADLPNVSVVREGDVTPWLIAASGVIAYRSTVVLQAAVNGIPVVQYKINAIDGIDDVPVFKVSKCVDTYEEVVAYLQAFRGQAGRAELKAQAIALLADDVTALGGETAASRIATLLDGVALQPQPPIHVHPLRRAASHAWDRYKYFEHRLRKLVFKKRASYRPSRFDKIPHGIQASEVDSIIRRLRAAEGGGGPEIDCRQVSTNLVAVEAF